MVFFTEVGCLIFNTLFQNFSALLKVEGHSQKTFCFVNANMKLTLSLAAHRSFSVYIAGFLLKFKKPKLRHRCRYFEQYLAGFS